MEERPANLDRRASCTNDYDRFIHPSHRACVYARYAKDLESKIDYMIGGLHESHAFEADLKARIEKAKDLIAACEDDSIIVAALDGEVIEVGDLNQQVFLRDKED